MSVSLEVSRLFGKKVYYEIGSGDFFHSFFSTIAYNLEKNKWGSRFPYIMNELYNGKLKYSHIDNAVSELKTISEELKQFPPDKIVWDIEDLSLQPPWGNNISSDITSLANYFVTSGGEDLLQIISAAFAKAKEMRATITIENI